MQLINSNSARIYAANCRRQVCQCSQWSSHEAEQIGLVGGPLGTLANLPATIGGIYARGVRIDQLHHIEEIDLVAHRRQKLRNEFTGAAKFEQEKIPTIVALDDAQSASFETLSLLSGLIAEDPSADGQDDDRGRVYMPAVLDAIMPSPLLIICTIWEHRLSFQDDFQIWLQELVDVGVHVTRIACGPMDLDTARGLMKSWNPKESRAIGNEVIDHIAFEANGLRVVNPLVFTQCVSLMEQSRDPLTNEL